MMSLAAPLTTLLLVVALYACYRILQVGKRRPDMPPGPPTIPILGNALQIPASGFYKQYPQRLRVLTSRMLTWSRKYGKVYSLMVGPSTMVILCDRKAVHELVDKKSAIYSDRPSDYVGHLLTQGDHMALHQMDKEWREMRKQIAHHFSPLQCDAKHIVIQEAEASGAMSVEPLRPSQVSSFTVSAEQLSTTNMPPKSIKSWNDGPRRWNQAQIPRWMYSRF